MKVLLLGGTSFFGKDIAQYFHEAGHQVTLFTRGNLCPSDLPAVRYFKGERNQRADLDRVAAENKWDVVIDNIAYDGSQVQMALSAFRDVGRYVLCSTVSVYRFAQPAGAQPIYENTVDFSSRPAAEDPSDVHWKYARGKLEAERVVVEQTKVPYTILRPPVVYGPFDITARGFWYLARLKQGGPLLLANGGANSFRLVYSRDVARSFLAAASTPKTLGRCYNVAQGEVITLKDFIDASADALKVKPQTVSVPLEWLGDWAGPYAGMINLVPDCSAAEKDFGFTTTPWAEFARTTAEWFDRHWTGDRAELLKTRSEELQFAKLWTEAIRSFGPRRLS